MAIDITGNAYDRPLTDEEIASLGASPYPGVIPAHRFVKHWPMPKENHGEESPPVS